LTKSNYNFYNIKLKIPLEEYSSCIVLNLSSGGNQDDITFGWELVRRVKPGNSWHPATDQLRGTDVYGTFVNDGTVDSTFSIAYDIDQVKDFLFITGDGEKWLVASAFAVTNDETWYQDDPRNI
jgi:hypothetical protein